VIKNLSLADVKMVAKEKAGMKRLKGHHNKSGNKVLTYKQNHNMPLGVKTRWLKQQVLKLAMSTLEWFLCN